ncbi:MAG TPA: hypothetical protein PKK61_04960, partial [Defluviitaleaceae bacterium]|nr:hypothetical protein [Defluviitaleaceae bacterium]
NKKPVENKDYWVEIRQLEKERKVEWIKVKGHSGNPWNEKADKLAVASIPMVDKKNDNDEVSRKTKIYLSEDEKKDLINFLEENKSFISKSLNDLLLRLKE